MAASAVIERFAGDFGTPPLAERRDAIDRCFAGDSLEEIIAKLEAEETEWATETLSGLKQRSPASLKITFRAIQHGAERDFDDVMTMEYRLSQTCMAAPDFYEGIRALIIEKDNSPRWQPAHLEEVGEDRVARYFEAPAAGDLTFD